MAGHYQMIKMMWNRKYGAWLLSYDDFKKVKGSHEIDFENYESNYSIHFVAKARVHKVDFEPGTIEPNILSEWNI